MAKVEVSYDAKNRCVVNATPLPSQDGSHDLNVYKSGKQMEDPKTYLGDQSKRSDV